MTIRVLSKTDWQNYFDHMSRNLSGKRAQIEVTTLALGSQLSATSVPLIGITYDRKDDVLEVALEGLDHIISKPRKIVADEAGMDLNSLEITDGDGRKQIVKLIEPLRLSEWTDNSQLR